MDNKNTHIRELVRKLLSRNISGTEEQKLNVWYDENQDRAINIPEEFE